MLIHFGAQSGRDPVTVLGLCSPADQEIPDPLSLPYHELTCSGIYRTVTLMFDKPVELKEVDFVIEECKENTLTILVTNTC